MDAIRVSGPINAAGLTMTLETGRLAQQADGAVLVRVGDTTVLSTVATSKPREGIDFFPLTVDVEERMYAAGKIPGGVFRREGRPSEPAILTCRLTDRPLRPSFPEGFRNEVQVIATILGADLVNPHDIASINGASAALMVSGIPFDGPIGACACRARATWLAHPSFEESEESTFELVVAGRMIDSGDIAIMMVEAGGTEATWRLYEEGAPKVTEEVIADGLEEAKTWIRESIELQKELRAALIRERGPIAPITYEVHTDYDDDVFETVAEQATPNTAEAMAIADKTDRNNRLDEILEGLLLAMCGTPEEPLPFTFAGRRTPDQARVPRAAEEGGACPHRQRGPAHRRSGHRRYPSAVGRGRHPPDGARLRPVRAGRDPGAQRPDAGHAPHGAVHRSRRDARHHEALHPPLQLPAVLHRRDRPGRLAEASRDRPRRARRAGAPSRGAVEGGVALRAPHRLRRAELQRLHVDGVGVRLHALDDGRRRAAAGAGRRHRDGSGVRRRQVHDPHRHPRHRGRLRRHGLQGGGHATSSPRSSSTPRSTVCPPTCSRRRCSRPATHG